jgi:hypothetical protein
VVVRVKPDPAAPSVVQVRGNAIRLLAPRAMEFDGFSWVAGQDATQDDIMARE